MTFRPLQEQERHSVPWGEVRRVATPSTGSTELASWRFLYEPGHQPPPHSHDRIEVVVFLTGRGTFTLGDESRSVEAGDAVVIPSGTPHRLEAEAGPLEGLACIPAGARVYGAGGEEQPTPPWMR